MRQGKQPRSLVNKLSHLMKDTKSSAKRALITKGSPQKVEMPQFNSNKSPQRGYKLMKSPEGKVTYAGGEDSNIINLRSTPKKDDPQLPTTIMETIEGVSGEVPKTSVLSDGEEDRLLTYDDEEELKKGESGMSSSEGEPDT